MSLQCLNYDNHYLVYGSFFFAFEMSKSGDSPMKGMASPSLGAILGFYFGIFCIALKVSVAGHL